MNTISSFEKNIYDFPIGSFVRFKHPDEVRVGIVVNYKENYVGETVLEIQWKNDKGYYGPPLLCHPSNLKAPTGSNTDIGV